MKRIGLSALVVLFVSSVFVELAFAGAWTVPKYRVWGEYYMKWDYGKDAFNDRNRTNSSGNHTTGFRSWEFVQEPKLEYGITDWLNALFSIEYKESHYKEFDRPPSWGPFSHKTHGITNLKFGGKWRLMKDPVVLSVQGKYFMYGGYGIDHGDDPSYSNQPSLGHGDDAFELRGLVGKRFDVEFINFTLPCYLGAETGYRWRSAPVCNDIPYFVEGGFWPRPWLLLKTEFDGYKEHGGTGSIKEGYGIWRAGGAWQVFGDSTLRKGDKIFNIEFLYGLTVLGKNTTQYQEWTLKIQTQF